MGHNRAYTTFSRITEEKKCGKMTGSLIPDFEEWIPGACCDSNAVLCYPKATDPVVVAGEHTYSVPLESVPYIAVEVVIASKQETTALGEGHWCNATHNHVMGVCHQLLQTKPLSKPNYQNWCTSFGINCANIFTAEQTYLVCTDVKQSTSGIIRACCKCLTIGEELQKDKIFIPLWIEAPFHVQS